MHPSAVTGKRPPLSPQEGWLSDGRQVLHFNQVRYSRYSQALELTTGVLIAGQAPLLKCRKEISGRRRSSSGPCQATSKTEPPGRRFIEQSTWGCPCSARAGAGCGPGNESPVGFYAEAMPPDLKQPATGDLIVLAGDEQLWRINWPGAPVLVVTKNGPGRCPWRGSDHQSGR